MITSKTKRMDKIIGHRLADFSACWPYISLGNNLFDLSGKSNIASNINNPQWVYIKYGYGLHYNGTTQYSKIGATPTYIADTQGTIVVWFSIDTLFSVDGIKKLYGLGGANNPAGNNGIFGFEIRRRDSIALGKTRLGVLQANDLFEWPTNVSGFMGNTDLAINIVYCAALVSNGSLWEIYLNGVKETLIAWGGDTNNGDWFGDTILTTPIDHSLAAGMVGGVMGGFLDGKIDIAMYWDYAFSQQEINWVCEYPLRMLKDIPKKRAKKQKNIAA